MAHVPEISVILPVYNGEAYVEEAISSILAQDFTDFELLVINDGSTDGSGVILEKMARQDGRIRILARQNDGLVSALNWGLSKPAPISSPAWMQTILPIPTVSRFNGNASRTILISGWSSRR
nr:glycosyltransferase family 2 protein [uncultured Cohaesibacter sp.]